ncbi:MAG: hypothetical protein JW782_04805 [Candidatus Saganbacteria bacterium]|nr:hypothetical protein [Candidatus Saganbacteria bacterium]
MGPQEKLQQDVRKFLEVYSVLSPEGKAQFEAQMNGEVRSKDERTKKLYYALLQAAKDGKDIKAAIEQMNRASN